MVAVVKLEGVIVGTLKDHCRNLRCSQRDLVEYALKQLFATDKITISKSSVVPKSPAVAPSATPATSKGAPSYPVSTSKVAGGIPISNPVVAPGSVKPPAICTGCAAPLTIKNTKYFPGDGWQHSVDLGGCGDWTLP